MVAGHVAVVGGEHNQRFLQPSPPLQCIQDPADLVVHKFHGAIVALPGTAYLGIAQVAMPDVVAIAAAGGVFLSPLAHLRFGQVSILILLPETLRRIIGAVRTGKRHLQEEGVWLVVALQEVDGGLCRPVGGVQVLWKFIRSRRVVVEPKPGNVRICMRRLAPEPGTVVTAKFRVLNAAGFVQNDVVKSMGVSLRMIVHLADAHGVVACVAERLRFGEGVAFRHSHHVQHAMIPWGKSGE